MALPLRQQLCSLELTRAELFRRRLALNDSRRGVCVSKTDGREAVLSPAASRGERREEDCRGAVFQRAASWELREAAWRCLFQAVKARGEAGSMISQVFILSPRGDCLISRVFTPHVPLGAAEIFMRHVRRSVSNGAAHGSQGGASSEAPPLFLATSGLSFAHLKRGGLLVALVTQQNPPPCLLVEALLRITKAITVSPGNEAQLAGPKGALPLLTTTDRAVHPLACSPSRVFRTFVVDSTKRS